LHKFGDYIKHNKSPLEVHEDSIGALLQIKEMFDKKMTSREVEAHLNSETSQYINVAVAEEIATAKVDTELQDINQSYRFMMESSRRIELTNAERFNRLEKEVVALGKRVADLEEQKLLPRREKKRNKWWPF
jgi:hypothetical protein